MHSSFQIPNVSPLSILGLTTLTVLSYKAIYFVHLYFLTPSRISRYLSSSLKDEQSWALVTGSSDGIGLETARALYKQGFNVLIHGRNPEKLSALADRLRSERPDCKSEIQYVVASATEPGKSTDIVAEHVRTKLNGGRLRVLINNLGYGIPSGHRVFHKFDELPAEVVQEVVDLNAIFPTLLTSKLLPIMRRPVGAVETDEDNVPVLIVNIGSIAGINGMPYIVSYAASKAFNKAFSYGLTAEMTVEKAPVEVLGILVGDVATANNNLTKPGFVTLTPFEMAANILKRVGCGVPVVVGSWRHALQVGLMDFLPDQVMNALIWGTLRNRRLEEDKTL